VPDWLVSDKQVLLYDLPAKAKDIYKKQTAEYKSYIDAFVKGINDYANDHPGVIDKEMKVVLPVMGEDVFANIQRTVYRFLNASERTATEKLFQPGSNATCYRAFTVRVRSCYAGHQPSPSLEAGFHFTVRSKPEYTFAACLWSYNDRYAIVVPCIQRSSWMDTYCEYAGCFRQV
jgi:hypothetical protein